MQKINNEGLARELTSIRNIGRYEKFDKGFFKSKPELAGYIYKSNLINNLYIIVNINKDYLYNAKYKESGKYKFIIANHPDFETYKANIAEVVNKIIEISKSKGDVDSGLPYGYYRDESGQIKVNWKEAREVKEIYQGYASIKSMKKLAKALKTNYSNVREILKDERYKIIKPPILTSRDIKKVEAISTKNVKYRGGKVNKVDNLKKKDY